MIDKKEIVDRILIINEKDPRDARIFNFHTWFEVVKGNMVKYAHKSAAEAEAFLLSSYLMEVLLDDIRTTNPWIDLTNHEIEYHWAMLLAYGEQYWLKGIPVEPEDYLEWDEQYRKDHNLAKESFVFIDDDDPYFLDNKEKKEGIVFNFYSWLEVIKGIMVKYAHKSAAEAQSLIVASSLIDKAADYQGIKFLSQQSEYHWAMELADGEYWQKGISTDFPEGYLEWNGQYRKDHNLAATSFKLIEG